jgi:hypothetical protein
MILLCVRVRRHYNKVGEHMKRLDTILMEIPLDENNEPRKPDPRAHTAVLMVKEYGGLGIHSFLSIQRLFPNHFKNVIFMSVINVDAGTLRGQDEVNQGMLDARRELEKYVHMAGQIGFAADYRITIGTDVVEEAAVLSATIAKEYPRSIFFAAKLVFEHERWYQRILHNETAYAIQRRLQFGAMNCMVLPVRVFGGR